MVHHCLTLLIYMVPGASRITTPVVLLPRRRTEGRGRRGRRRTALGECEFQLRPGSPLPSFLRDCVVQTDRAWTEQQGPTAKRRASCPGRSAGTLQTHSPVQEGHCNLGRSSEDELCHWAERSSETWSQEAQCISKQQKRRTRHSNLEHAPRTGKHQSQPANACSPAAE